MSFPRCLPHLGAAVGLCLSVGSALGGIPFHGQPAEVDTVIEGEDFDIGGQGIAFHVWPTNASANEYRSELVSMAPFSVTSGLAVVLRPGEWADYSVIVRTAGVYRIDAWCRAEACDPAAAFHWELDGLIAGQTFAVDPNVWDDSRFVVTTHPVPLSAGIHEFRFIANRCGDNVQLGHFSFAPAFVPPAFLFEMGGNSSGYKDGLLSEALFSSTITGMEFDAEGNLMIADSGNLRVRKATAEGNVMTLAGSGKAGWVDAVGTNASFNDFNMHRSLAVDGLGNTFLLDRNRGLEKCRIRQIQPDGTVTTRIELPLSSGNMWVESYDYRSLSVDAADRIHYMYVAVGEMARSINYFFFRLTEAPDPELVWSQGSFIYWDDWFSDVNMAGSQSTYFAGWVLGEQGPYYGFVRVAGPDGAAQNLYSAVEWPEPGYSVTGRDLGDTWLARKGSNVIRLSPDGGWDRLYASSTIGSSIAIDEKGAIAFVDGYRIRRYSGEPGVLVQAFSRGGGTVTSSPSGPYVTNSTVNFQAQPAAGWTFLGWIGEVEGSDPDIAVVADEHKTLNATFGLEISTTATHGQVRVEPIRPHHPYGSVVTMKAEPDPGYEFLQWNDGVTDPVRELLVIDWPVPTPDFAALETFSFTSGALDGLGGSVEQSPDQPWYYRDTELTLIARPDAGHRFVSWSDGNFVNPRHLLVQSNTVVYAAFGLGILAAPQLISAPTSVVVKAGSTVDFRVQATGGSPLEIQWSRNGVAVPGATRPMLHLDNVQAGDAGAYQVTVTNLAGVVSAEATLEVLPRTRPRLEIASVSEGYQLTLEGEPGTEYLIQQSQALDGWSDFIRLVATNAPFQIRLPVDPQAIATFFRATEAAQ